MNKHGAVATLSATDAELLADFSRLVERNSEHHLQIAVVHWDGQEPCLAWKTARRWKRLPSAERLASAQQTVLNTPRFFRVCRECKQRVNAGHLDGDICHGCMTRVWGVVF